MRDKIAWIVVVLLFIIAGAVAINTLATTTRSGLVYQKSFIPGHWGTKMIGKVPVRHFYEDGWFFHIQSCPSGQLESWPGQGCKTGGFYVTKSTFDTVEPGSHIAFAAETNYVIRILTGLLAMILIGVGGLCIIASIMLVEYAVAKIVAYVLVASFGIAVVTLGLYFVQRAFDQLI